MGGVGCGRGLILVIVWGYGVGVMRFWGWLFGLSVLSTGDSYLGYDLGLNEVWVIVITGSLG